MTQYFEGYVARLFTCTHSFSTPGASNLKGHIFFSFTWYFSEGAREKQELPSDGKVPLPVDKGFHLALSHSCVALLLLGHKLKTVNRTESKTAFILNVNTDQAHSQQMKHSAGSTKRHTTIRNKLEITCS